MSHIQPSQSRQALAISATTAVITAAGLIYQQWRADKREGRRLESERLQRENEREHERAMASAGRQHELSSTWRVDRWTAHATLLRALDHCFGENDIRLDDYREMIAQDALGQWTT